MRKVIAALLALTMSVAAADGVWERLKTIRPGEKIWIKFMDGEKLKSAKAEMGAWDENSLAVRLKNSEVVLSRRDVRQVAVYGGKSRSKGAAIGALVGAGMGAGLYGAAIASDSADLEIHPAIAVVGGSLFIGAIGAGIGALVGSTKTVPIYEAVETAAAGAANGRE